MNSFTQKSKLHISNINLCCNNINFKLNNNLDNENLQERKRNGKRVTFKA